MTRGSLQEQLFELEPNVRKPKKPKLGRYEQLRRELEEDASDPRKVFVDFAELPSGPKLKFVDLFCGAGGISCGLSKAGYEAVAAVELVDVACRTHARNFPDCRLFRGPIEAFHPVDKLGEQTTIDLVVGGPPCQGFSVAGRRNPDDPRNQLFKQFMRVVAELRPPYVVMENVPGLLTMSNGAFREAIHEAFADAGYEVSVAVLESAAYGVPQLRPRAIFVANRVGFANPFPKPQLKPAEYKPIEPAIADLHPSAMDPGTNHEWTKHSKLMVNRIAEVPPGGSLYETYVDAWKRQYPGMPAMTIKENHGGTHIHPSLNRVLSAREMARLQTFPDEFVFEGSMKKAMWQIGNAVPPRLAEVIGLALRPSILAAKDGNASPVSISTSCDLRLVSD